MSSRNFASQIRNASNADSEAVIRLIDSVLGEWDDAVCLEGAEADLVDLQAYYWDRQGGFFVLEQNGEVAGTHGIIPLDSEPGQCGLCTFKRLYLHPALRGTGAGQALMKHNLDWARDHGFRRVEFWSDSRFHRAHRFFSKLGFTQSSAQREMNDSHQTYWEYHFFLDLA